MASRESWGSRVGLVLAMAGNAVGLGNFLRFPAQAAQNGGGAFLIPYLVSFVLMGIPLLWVEWAIGRYGGQFGHHSTPGMLDVIGKRRFWKYVGVCGLFTNLTVAAYYSYIESWTLAYVWYSIRRAFAGMTPEEVSRFFSEYTDTAGGGFVNLPGLASVFFLITLALNVWILSRGLARGIEVAAKIGMPLLILFGIFLAIRSLTLDPGEAGARESARAGLNYLWDPQLSSLKDPKVWLAAAGQIFFTLSLGMGSIHCYAAYVRRRQDIALNAASAGWMNEFVEVVLGGSIVIPLAVAYLGLAWVQDPGNIGFMMGFRVLPTLFQHFGPFLSVIAGVMWFSLLFFAGITSSLAMGQPVMAFLQDELGVERRRSAGLFGLWTLVLAVPCVIFFGAGAFDEFDWWAGSVSLVIFALCECVLFSWVWGVDAGWEEITRGADMKVPRVFRFVLRCITPVFLIVVFVGALIKPRADDWAAAAATLPNLLRWPLAHDSILGSILHVDGDGKYHLFEWFQGGSPTPFFIQDLSRLLLLGTFALLCALVARAWQRRRNAAGGLR